MPLDKYTIPQLNKKLAAIKRRKKKSDGTYFKKDLAELRKVQLAINRKRKNGKSQRKRRTTAAKKRKR